MMLVKQDSDHGQHLNDLATGYRWRYCFLGAEPVNKLPKLFSEPLVPCLLQAPRTF